jgi:hypothetical protein
MDKIQTEVTGMNIPDKNNEEEKRECDEVHLEGLGSKEIFYIYFEEEWTGM